MTDLTGRKRAIQVGVALALAATGYLHAALYLDGYRRIPVIGPAFLLQASGSFAVALLLILGAPLVLQLAAAALAGGALIGFVLSRTVGVAGFVERGLQPAPQALESLLAESAVLTLVAASLLLRARRPHLPPPSSQ